MGLFSLLSTAYSNQLGKLMHQGLGMVLITKRFFYPLFRKAFHTAFTKKNILSAFEKTSIYLFNPSKVLDKLKKPKVLETPVSEPNQF
jgi:hypothetical protein